MSTSVSTQRLGITELGTGFNIDFNDAWHYAIQGMTRSGKSVLVYSLLAPLAACDNVRICGVDPTGDPAQALAGAPRQRVPPPGR